MGGCWVRVWPAGVGSRESEYGGRGGLVTKGLRQDLGKLWAKRGVRSVNRQREAGFSK